MGISVSMPAVGCIHWALVFVVYAYTVSAITTDILSSRLPRAYFYSRAQRAQLTDLSQLASSQSDLLDFRPQEGSMQDASKKNLMLGWKMDYFNPMLRGKRSQLLQTPVNSLCRQERDIQHRVYPLHVPSVECILIPLKQIVVDSDYNERNYEKPEEI